MITVLLTVVVAAAVAYFIYLARHMGHF